MTASKGRCGRAQEQPRSSTNVISPPEYRLIYIWKLTERRMVVIDSLYAVVSSSIAMKLPRAKLDSVAGRTR